VAPWADETRTVSDQLRLARRRSRRSGHRRRCRRAVGLNRCRSSSGAASRSVGRGLNPDHLRPTAHPSTSAATGPQRSGAPIREVLVGTAELSPRRGALGTGRHRGGDARNRASVVTRPARDVDLTALGYDGRSGGDRRVPGTRSRSFDLAGAQRRSTRCVSHRRLRRAHRSWCDRVAPAEPLSSAEVNSQSTREPRRERRSSVGRPRRSGGS
jgi:hypothetical protein